MIESGRLGRNYWIFQSGQMISIIGDACGNIALAWWILDATGSAGKISAVIAPALLTQTLLTPLVGPLGDRFSRKWIIFIADLLRGSMLVGLAVLAITDRFSLPWVTGLYLVFSVGSALFNANNMSIVPQLVSADVLHRAVQRSQALEAIGRVLGGVLAGVLVTWIGVGVALLVDGVSFGLAALATASIGKLSLSPRPPESIEAGKHPLGSFLRQLREGFQVVHRIPVLFWLCISVAFFNLLFSPMQILLPAFAKQAKAMPAWFLGGLESSLGLGMVLGALGIDVLEKVPRRVSCVVVGLGFLGLSMTFLAHLPGIILPFVMMFLAGIGAAWTNIPIGTRVSVAVPDHFRSRVNSIFSFLSDGMGPLGVAGGGLLVASFGVTHTMTALGVTALLCLPLLFLIPSFVAFFRRTPATLNDYFLKTYPDVFNRK